MTAKYAIPTGQSAPLRVGVVVIGRNEGERLRRCLASLHAQAPWVVYVDSGSTDGSADLAVTMGATVHALDLRQPFTAARARNAGVARLRALAPGLEFIQFVDGDCEVDGHWLDTARTFLEAHAEVAAVCGRRRERHPEHSVYNRLCDTEWDTPIGEAKACGGDVMIRAAALQQVVGYRDDLIAGEEPELCVRLRANGWKVWRLDAEMTLHDAAMTRFGQWWMRCLRAGFAYAEGVRLHGAPPERHWVRESRSAWVWGSGIPLVALALGLAAGSWGAAVLLAYPLQVLRIGSRLPRGSGGRWSRAFFLVAGKFPEALGQMKAWVGRLLQRRAAVIEYK